MIFHSYQPARHVIILTYLNLTGEELHKHFASVPILFTLYYFKYYIYCTDNYEINMFKPTSRYLDDLLNIDNPYFEGMVNQIYPSELQLNKANTSDTEAPFLDLHHSVYF